MKALMVMVAGTIGFAAPAHAQWTDVAGGKRHDATGLVCPVMASGFELKALTVDEQSFSCRYEIRCQASDACKDALGFASVTWNRRMDFGAQFIALATRQGLTTVKEPGPEWAGPTKMYAQGGEGANRSAAGWWFIQSKDEPLHVGAIWNAGGEEAARALVEAAAQLNP